jgi:hypothetical protein
MKIKRDIVLTWGWLRREIKIPAGSIFIPARNLPYKDAYWLKSLPAEVKSYPINLRREIKSWHKIYGFMIRLSDLKPMEDAR